MPVDRVRDAALDVVLRVFERGVHLDDSLAKTIRRKNPNERGRRFLTQLAYGTVRHRLLCDHVLQGICHQPLDKLPAPIRAVLRMGIFQSLFCEQVTHPAMVHTSVDLARHRGHAGTARLVNAVLRKAPQHLDSVALPGPADSPAEYMRLRYSLPRWLGRLWCEELGEDAALACAEASCTQAPTTIRVNLLRTTPEALREKLAKSGIAAVSQTPVPEELTVVDGGNLASTKWFQAGLFMLQDPASMLAAHLMEPQPGERVLDLCAAPGGKTAHLAERAGNQARVVALDAVFNRLYRVVENKERLGLDSVAICCGDGACPPLAGGFDRVLADAPCSGLGTLRRRPDLKWHMDRESIARLSGIQAGLLRSAARLCKNGGIVVFAVCTFTRQETVDVVQAVLEDGELELENGPEWLNQWRMSTGQYRILPTNGGLDGFFLTRFRKVS